MKLLNVPFVIITISTVFGIILEYYLRIHTTALLLSFFISVCLLGISWKRSKKMFSKGSEFLCIMIITFIAFGATLVTIHNPSRLTTHYTYQIEEFTEKPIGLRFYIRERLKSTTYYNKYIISILRIEDKMVHGNVLLRTKKGSSQNDLNIGDTYTAVTAIKQISKPLNPYQFDYSKHLEKKYIHHQITIPTERLITNQKSIWSVFRFADLVRKYINQKLDNYPFNPKQLSIINALLLGQKQDIDQETFGDYRDAGAIHILAVSGLHVGILLLILNFILSPLQRFKQRGKIVKLILTILMLWFFAIIAGLSPSILRAVTMFSFIAVGMQIRSKTSIYNSLFISMFVLLCFYPLYLFSVGFQLSYLAVFGIVWIQPTLINLFRPNIYISQKLWETLTVTISAQLGILPLSLYYFNQFPALFFLSNLLIIPFLGGILGFGILVILLASLDLLPDIIAYLFGGCIDLMNWIVSRIAQQEEFLITDIPFSWRMLVILYVIIIAIIASIKKFEKRKVYAVGISLCILMCILIYEKQKNARHEEFIVFHTNQNTTLGIFQNQRLAIYSKKNIPKNTQNFLFGNYLVQNAGHRDSILPLKNIYQYKEHTILIIDSTSIYNITSLQPDIIILSGSPKIHLDRVIDTLHPKQIIADGSSYKSFLNEWGVTCKKRNIKFHRTDKKGAFIFND